MSVLLAQFPRCYVDLNRAADDIDVSMLEDPSSVVASPTEKSKKGLGLFRKLVIPGYEIYDRKLTAEELEKRMEKAYWPYHRCVCGKSI